MRIVGLLDRSGYVFDARGLSRARLRGSREQGRGRLLAALGGTPRRAAEALAFIAGHAVSRPVLVDVTSDDTGRLLQTALGQRLRPRAREQEAAGRPVGQLRRTLLARPRDAGRRIRYEATVGAGLPVIDTSEAGRNRRPRAAHRRLCERHADVRALGGIAGRPFSEAVIDAVQRGYAEPDPRDDLSGQDAARKGVILARLLGYRGPAAGARGSGAGAPEAAAVAAFMQRLPSLDADWQGRVAREAARGQVLRYVVSATPARASAKLVAVPATSPMGAAGGTRNLITFTSARYRDEPLVVSGPAPARR